MATRSNLAIKNSDGTYDQIYVHWCGAPEDRLPILHHYYNTEKKARKLIEGGAISILRKFYSTKKEHTFDNPQENVTIVYHRDRGEELEIQRALTTPQRQEEYLYIWNGKKWIYRK